MWVDNNDTPEEWANGWSSGPHATVATQARRINRALELEKRLAPLGVQKWILRCSSILSSDFYLEAEHADIPFLVMVVHPAGTYKTGRKGGFAEYDHVRLHSDSSGENCRGEILRMDKRFDGATAVADAVAFIESLPVRQPLGMDGYYEVLEPIPEEE